MSQWPGDGSQYRPGYVPPPAPQQPTWSAGPPQWAPVQQPQWSPPAPRRGPSPLGFMVVLLIVVGLVVAGLQTLPIGTDPVPLPGSSTTPSPSSSTPTTNKSTGVGVPELTDSALYRQTLSGTCPKPVKTISSRSQYQQQVDDLIACLETLYRPVIDSAGGDFSTVSRTFYDKTVASPCGKETDAYAFYCETDNTMYFSNRVYEDAQYARLSVADVVVHEYGHHVQAMMNFFDESDGLDEKRTVTIRRIELQVFCWTYYVFAHVPSFELTGSDKEFFLDVWGDTTDAEGHGSVKAQQYWGPRGLDGENLGACNTWAVNADKVK